jgi:hypothetical protein
MTSIFRKEGDLVNDNSQTVSKFFNEGYCVSDKGVSLPLANSLYYDHASDIAMNDEAEERYNENGEDEDDDDDDDDDEEEEFDLQNDDEIEDYDDEEIDMDEFVKKE